MLAPKKTKFRKQQRGRMYGHAQRGATLSFGDFGLQALDRGWMSSRQIEACRVAINRELNRKGKVWIRVFPHKPITSRPPETRMGKGKGPVEDWVAVIRPGTMLFEIAGVPESAAREAMRLASYKLGSRTRFVSRSHHSA